MRITPFLVSAVLTAGLVFTLDKKWGTVPPIGKFLSPQFGIWQNAEPTDKDFSMDGKFDGLNGKVEVIFDERLVPHIFADDDADACFVQGWLHARFRLWQMEFQTHAAAGRISEIIGSKAINFDKAKRRLGMVYAAEKLEKEVDANPFTKIAVDNYTAGVNAYISTLKESELPIEYKLLDYQPEKWTNLKTALFIKQMTETLAGHVDDLLLTSAKSFFSDDELKILFPQVPDSLSAIVPNGTAFTPASVIPVKPATADSLYLGKKDTAQLTDLFLPDKENGSNNWAVSGAKTQSGSPILSNDPHLELSFPSIWYEMQMSSSTMNAYGVSFPGIPGIVIGFNDSIAFGFTNSQRDVRDYYEIKFKDGSKQQYWFNNEWKDAQIKVETIQVRGSTPLLDTVAYTIFGPVMYDASFPADTNNINRNLAVRWAAHDASNELLMWYYLDRAKNYEDYYQALQYFTCPPQNIVFASRRGDIAI
ncbi:MAG TPA: penicillin acylase family protein, partial [Chitinophagaceae bacterium]|nr:penicillin acylase family protein [Chitinophagaceae bacterium]